MSVFFLPTGTPNKYNLLICKDNVRSIGISPAGGMIPPPDCTLTINIINNTTNIVNVIILFVPNGQLKLQMKVCPNSNTVVNNILRFDNQTTIQTNRRQVTDPSCGTTAEFTNFGSNFSSPPTGRTVTIQYDPTLV